MENRTFGYVRVSSKDQNEARQVSALLDFGVISAHPVKREKDN